MYYIASVLTVALIITVYLYIYHNIKYHMKKKDILVSVSEADKHEAKSQGYLIASLGLLFPIFLSLWLI